jgi:hypothetical protein
LLHAIFAGLADAIFAALADAPPTMTPAQTTTAAASATDALPPIMRPISQATPATHTGTGLCRPDAEAVKTVWRPIRTLKGY